MVQEIITKDKKGRERVKETKIFVGEKEIRLRFTMPMWYRMEREICVLDDVYTMMHERDRFEADKVPALIAMMSGDVITPKELLREVDPSTMKALMNEAQRVMAEAITMKEKKYDDDSVHDETLEEIEKKEPRAD